jgi:hypothetical protein
MNELDVKYRLAVSLCHEQGLTKREAAAVLGVPESTVSDRVRAGLDELRQRLSAAGFGAAAVASLPAALAETAPVVPAAFTAAIEKMVGGGAMVKGSGAASGSAALKGGVLVKIGLGIAAAGLVAGTTLWAGGGKSEEPAKPKAPNAVEGPKSKFDTPVWSPDARWERYPKPFVASFPGELAGPRQETMWRHAWGSAPTQFPGMTQGGRQVCYTYDPRTERYFPMAGSTQGWLDGPFSRARFGGANYICRPRAVLSPDGRYGYMNDVGVGGKLRLFDFERQEVRTLFPDKRFGGSMVVNSKGELLSIAKDGTLLTIAPDGSAMKQGPKLDLKSSIGGMGDGGATLALDEAKNRIYASSMDNSWYYWYWDLADGSFHGVIPVPKEGESTRNRPGIALPIPGPFKGTALYGEGTALIFGPDDPGRRFLYSTRVDTAFVFRLDLEKEIISVFCAKEGLAAGRELCGCRRQLPLVFVQTREVRTEHEMQDARCRMHDERTQRGRKRDAGCGEVVVILHHGSCILHQRRSCDA